MAESRSRSIFFPLGALRVSIVLFETKRPNDRHGIRVRECVGVERERDTQLNPK
jgi:hypothetical protein